MSYLVLARKYRPKTFREMVGQEHVVQALSNALTQQRLHHAYLFTGTRGVGKTTVSRILAKSLNCQGPDGHGGITAQPCGTCPACKEIDAGRFVDYTELDAASNRGVDEVQSLLEQAVYKPVQGRFKVFMIDEVHMLTGHAFNAMLKTLEEPPEYLKFVLATTDPQKVPVTVLSRCLQFNLRPMAPETVQEHLARVLEVEQVPADAQALRLLARAARGSMRDALSLTDQAIAFGSGRIEEAGVRVMLGSVDRSHVFRLIDALAQADGRTVVQTCEELRVHGLSAGATLEEMTAVLQRMAVLQAVPSARDDTDAEVAEIARLALALPPDETQLLYSMCLHGRAELGLAPDEYAALTMVLLRLLAFKPSPGVDGSDQVEKKTSPEPLRPVTPPAAAVTVSAASGGAVAARTLSDPPAGAATPSTPAMHRVEEPRQPDVPSPRENLDAPSNDTPPGQVLPVLEPPVRNTPTTAAERRPATPVVGVPVREASEPRREAPIAQRVATEFTRTEEGDFWHAIVQQLIASDSVTALVRELALQSQLVARDTDHWLLRIDRESLNQSSTRERLQAALQAAGHPVKLGVEVGGVIDSPARRNAFAAAARQKAAEETILADPFVQQMVRDFGARIVPGSIKPVNGTQRT